MKRITFTVDLVVTEDDYNQFDSPRDLAEAALALIRRSEHGEYTLALSETADLSVVTAP